MNDIFSNAAQWTARQAGCPASFTVAIITVLMWAAAGPFFGFSDTWQLVINTGTTIITFLMVFLIQNTQNRDTQAIQIKLNELIRATTEARNDLIDLEDASEAKIQKLKEEFAGVKEQEFRASAENPHEVRRTEASAKREPGPPRNISTAAAESGPRDEGAAPWSLWLWTRVAGATSEPMPIPTHNEPEPDRAV